MKDPLSIYTPTNCTRMLVIAGLLITVIAAVDWWATHHISLGFLYLFPIIIVGGFLPRTWIVGIAQLCAVLQDAGKLRPPGYRPFTWVHWTPSRRRRFSMFSAEAQ